MGRRKKPKPTPSSIREFIKTKTDWETVLENLTKLAMGGYTFQNYNGQQIMAEPNLEAMRLLLTFSYGRPGETAPDTDSSNEALQDFARFVHRMNTPSIAQEDKPSTKTKNITTNTDGGK